MIRNLTTPFLGGKSHIMLALCHDVIIAADYIQIMLAIIFSSLPPSPNTRWEKA